MTLTVRSFLRLIASFVASLAGRSVYAQQGTAPRETLSRFIERLRSLPSLRARFAENPHQVLREARIDPSAYNLPDRLTDAQVNSFLEDLSRQVAAMPPPPPEKDAGQRVPVPVYGPPPGVRRP